MSTRYEYEGASYAWVYDRLCGVGWFVRLSDGAQTLIETGSDCQDVRRTLHRTKQKTSSPKYPKSAPCFRDLLDSLASEYTFEK